LETNQVMRTGFLRRAPFDAWRIFMVVLCRYELAGIMCELFLALADLPHGGGRFLHYAISAGASVLGG